MVRTLFQRKAFIVFVASLFGVLHATESTERATLGSKTLAHMRKAVEYLSAKEKNDVKTNSAPWNLHFLKVMVDKAGNADKVNATEHFQSPEPVIEESTTDELNQNMTTGKSQSPVKPGSEEDFVMIGESKIPANKVAAVGDVDGNGVEDFIVRNPASNYNRGTIRLYLMAKDNKFLYTRDLVPGKYGFNSDSLKPGDRFGASVLKISNDSPNFSFIAVTAPGDRMVPGKKGAFYVLQLSDKGNVLNNVKLSASTIEKIASQQSSGREVDSVTIPELKESSLSKRIVDILSNKTSMLLVRKEGQIKGAYVISSNDDQMLLKHLEKQMTPRNKLETMRLLSPAVRPALSSSCFFNDTHCACGSKSPTVGSNDCTQVVGTDQSTGRTLCQKRDCQASFQCSCDGTSLCQRAERTMTSYITEGPAPGGMMYCSPQQRTITENVVIPGASVPVVVDINDLPPFNATHCRCTPKQAIVGSSTCLDFLRTESSIAIVCSVRECRIGSSEHVCDAFGDSYCERTFADKIHYVNNGDRLNEPGTVYCHRESYQSEVLVKVL
ncbi:hypothetical protein BWQ96_09342 [Gracilariopsis chorda]|uniref:Uncharacterized protein n=1 Tax=Gracilariopsis chorda TaxID=448386 RepID=A0A2V3IFU4_9FLOR|nr:hypothetical protein BWQ96_09342 [Gracilariopsis chorda]|eukprot:PXF40947.1 hypothetical protein BWQ96_09342 [Gracilariopsis chorda]